jgi:hypothetical protein
VIEEEESITEKDLERKPIVVFEEEKKYDVEEFFELLFGRRLRSLSKPSLMIHMIEC